ncbi:MAG: hypothetical protein R3332_02130 [Pseudohongiellaceae bacterium]|nr:hypothetical protein [Pseudohongiellaceae bacterium]
MSVVISVVVVAAVLAGIVYFLHSNQEKQKIESAERSDPLPPLEKNLLDSVEQEHSPDSFELTSPTISSAATKPSRSSKKQSNAKPAPGNGWLEQCKEMRDSKRFDEAIALCEPHYPQLNAFKQACLVLRAQIRDMRKAQEDEQAVRAKLVELHRLACCSAFFHEKADELPPPLTANKLKELEAQQWQAINTDYESIGYEHIPLLTVTDQKLLGEILGQPRAHEHMRQYNSELWQALG